MKKIMHAVLFVATTVATVTTTFAGSNVAFQQYFRGDYTQAYPKLEVLSKAGNAKATYLLANIKLYGYGDKKDIAKGREYMHLAAKKDDLAAQMYLGAYYLNQEKNLKESLFWLKKAASQGDQSAQLAMALAYLHGLGVKKNITVAKKYLIKTAKKNIPMAQYELGKIFSKSRYAVDRKMGRIWLSKAKKNGYFPEDIVKNNSQEEQAALPLNQLAALLKKAGVNIHRASPRLAPGTDQTEMPKLSSLSMKKVMYPDYAMITSGRLQVADIVSAISQQNYQKQIRESVDYTNKKLLPAIHQEHDAAVSELSRQVTFGHIPGMYQLGLHYLHGVGVPKDKRKALDLFFEAAKQKYAKAEYMVGLFCLNGWVVNKSIMHAEYWLRRSALHGDANAQWVLGNLYEHGLKGENAKNTITRNISRTKAMYSLAAQSGLASAQYQLASLYAAGVFNPTHNAVVARHQLRLARNLYKKAASQGIVPAKIALSYFYLNAKKRAHQQYALTIARKYADHYESARLLLGLMYSRGMTDDKGAKGALKIYQSLASKSAIAQFMLGMHYYQDKENDLARKHLKQSALKGFLPATYNLALFDKQQKKHAKSADFTQLLEKAASQHFNQASLLLADYYFSKRADGEQWIEKALTAYKKLANQKDAVAQMKLGYIYQHGLGVKKDPLLAIRWYKKSAQYGNVIAQYQLGEMYLLGVGVARNVDVALKYYKKAAKQDFVPAMLAMGYIMQVDKLNYQRARDWYQKAAEHDNQQARKNLVLLNGVMHTTNQN